MARPIPSPELPPIERLKEIMHLLRAPGGCPWDAEQTHESLTKHLIEEAYEVAEAIESGVREDIVDELGDLLLQPVFHAEIASETGAFDLDDIARAIGEKLIRRHPHVFGDSVADDPDAVLTQWEEIKATEKPGGEVGTKRYFKTANEGLPSLMAAQKLQKKAAKVGFDWPELEPVVAKIHEELGEVEEALEAGENKELGDEIGDLLFAVVNLARKTGNEAELLLHRTNRKFVCRFHEVEKEILRAGGSLEDATLEEMDHAWEVAKMKERGVEKEG
ncbi:MAG: nucleoside triphosphate pyrophosphohydrolase [Verrucomicrobiales bacterium]|nr:nucleoside triphosphate pyrophosphohydrolase [Verrucomicrobiales bacterium]